METFTYDELRMMRDALNELDQAITPETSVFNPLMDKLDRMIQSKDKGQYSLYSLEEIKSIKQRSFREGQEDTRSRYETRGHDMGQ